MLSNTVDDDLGLFSLTFDYEGTLLKPSNAVQDVWVVSNIHVGSFNRWQPPAVR